MSLKLQKYFKNTYSRFAASGYLGKSTRNTSRVWRKTKNAFQLGLPSGKKSRQLFNVAYTSFSYKQPWSGPSPQSCLCFQDFQRSKLLKDAIGVVLVALLLTLNISHLCSIVSILNFEQVNAGWVAILKHRIFFSRGVIFKKFWIEEKKHIFHLT